MRSSRTSTIASRIQTVENSPAGPPAGPSARTQLPSTPTPTSFRRQARPEGYTTPPPPRFSPQAFPFSTSSGLSPAPKGSFVDPRSPSLQTSSRMPPPQKQPQASRIQEFRIFHPQASPRRFRGSIQSAFQPANVQAVDLFNFDCACSAFPMGPNAEWKENVATA